MQSNGDKIYNTFFFFKGFYFLFWITTLIPSFHVKLSSIHWYFKKDLSNVLCLELLCYHGLTPTNSQTPQIFTHSPGWDEGQNWKNKSERSWLRKHRSAVRKTSPCYQSCLQHNSKVQQHTYCEKNSLHPSENQHTWQASSEISEIKLD